MHASDLGFLALVVTLVAAAYSIVASIAGAKLGLGELVISGRNAAWVVSGAMLTSAAVLLYCFWILDFGVEFVARNASAEQPRMYSLAAFYGGQEGSLLLWAVGLAVFSGAAIFVNRNRLHGVLPYSTATLMFIQLFFAVVLVFLTNPFERLAMPLADGQGLNPLLRHPGMIAHPPFLLTGFMSWSIPFGFAVGALITGRLDNQWMKAVRPWVLLAWAIQGTGLLLGSWWAYHVLGWGGYWGWDPVENVALLPWLMGTALLHSALVQERRGMLKKWNILLVLLAFNLAILGTLTVRGGLLSSVHNFAKSAVGPAFLVLLGITTAGSIFLFLRRSSLLKSEAQFESYTSKETAFLFNNLLLAGAAFATFWGTLFPLMTEAFNGSKLTVGPPFYNRVNGPIVLFLLLFMGIGPLLAWRRTSWDSIRRNFRWPLLGAFTWAMVMVFGLHIRNGWTLLGVSACAFAFGAIVLEYTRGARARRRATGEAYPAALGNLVAHDRRRYGGYIVHIAILMIALGNIGWNLHRTEKQITLSQGQSAQVGDYTFVYKGTDTYATKDSSVDEALLEAYRGGKLVSVLKPNIEVFRNFDSQPSSHVAIRTTAVEDIYVFLAAYDSTQATFVVFINPLVVWIWLGGGVFLLGTLIAFWPAGERRLETAPIREGAARVRPGAGAHHA